MGQCTPNLDGDEERSGFKRHYGEVLHAVGVNANPIVLRGGELAQRGIEPQAEYAICIPKGACSLEQLRKFERWTGKTVKSSTLEYYWYDGKPTVEAHGDLADELYPSYIEGEGEAEFGLRLPAWLDHFIFCELGARFEPSRLKREFNFNLNSSLEQVKQYLGTYFPRSLCESFVIFDSLFRR